MLRRLSPEIMDDPELPPSELAHALAGLARLNAISGSFSRTFRVIEAIASEFRRPVRVLDVACARGDFVLAGAREARSRGLQIEFCGCDINPHAIEIATAAALRAELPCSFFACDALLASLPRGFDVCTASLFFHHLEAEQAISLLQNMAASGSCVIVNDLVRSPANLGSIAVASRVLSRSGVVHTDALLSARAAFTRAEMQELADCAGLDGATIRWGGVCRMMLIWRKPS